VHTAVVRKAKSTPKSLLNTLGEPPLPDGRAPGNGRDRAPTFQSLAPRQAVCRPFQQAPRSKRFEHEWTLQPFETEPSFFTKRMFGGLAVYLFGRMMLLYVEPTRTGRWKWHGVLICTDPARQPAIVAEFPQLAPHDVLKKWLYLDSRDEDFEGSMRRIARAIIRDDPRFGIRPDSKKEKTGLQPRRRKR
jgi:hypothetical protein